MKNLAAIGLIWFGCALAWVILGSTLVARSGGVSNSLTEEVHQLWGPPLQQPPPVATYAEQEKRTDEEAVTDAAGRSSLRRVEREVRVEHPLPLEGTEGTVRLELTHRQKGLLWFPTYSVDFKVRYTFSNPTQYRREATIRFPLASARPENGPSRDNPPREGESKGTIFADFQVVDQEGKPLEPTITQGVASWTASLSSGETRNYTVSYRTRGTSNWHYLPTSGTSQVRNLALVVDTDFGAVDFPAGTISPTAHGRTPGGWHGEWRFVNLVSGAPIGLELPQLLNPGPLAARMTFFAPVGLLFFFFVVAVMAAGRGRFIHPMNYFFLGCAFFAFHLLFAYLVDHLSILGSFGIAAVVSVLLVVSYARWFVGWRFALLEMGLSQLLYLVMFSFTFFWEGYTGLSITVGAIGTLFVMMQFTGRIRWGHPSAGLEQAAEPLTSGVS